MDTKWRRFSRSRAVRVLLVLMYIGCFFAMGLITGYAPAHGYNANDYVYCAESLFADNYAGSSAYRQQVYNSFYRIRNLVNEGHKLDLYTETFLEELDELPFYCEIKFGGITRTNNKPANNIYCVEYDFGSSTIQTKQGIEINSNRDMFNTSFLLDDGDYVKFGFSDGQIESYAYSWGIMRRNTQIILCSSLALLVVSIVLLTFLCRVSGEDAEGNPIWSRFYALPYEITIGACFGAAMLYLFLMLADGGVLSICNTRNGRAFFTFLCGLSAVLFGELVQYLFVSIAVRRKNKRLLRGSLIGLALILCVKLLNLLLNLLKAIGKQVCRFFGFVKEVFTGEMYASGTVARKLIFLDAVFIFVSCLLFVIILLSECAPLLILEFVFLGLFIFGRVLLIKDEAKLEKQISMIYSGSYDYKPQLEKNSPYSTACEQLSEISAQYSKRVDEAVKAERTKMELVTNVSHDLKTPLTSIIGYVELLSKEELPEEAAEYVRILQTKSERLRNIVADVFELAKTTSGEISIEKEPLDLTKLSYQTLGEMEDKIASSGLDIKVNICEPPVTVISDGKRLYRVIQNLLDNALKYSLHGTRIYYTLEKHDNRAYITIKNIASYEMTFTKEEVLERFTRGDKARSTEGTGLGLSIAQGFTLACGGAFDIDIDGDMFKVVLSFPIESVSLNKTVDVDE